MLSKIFTSHGQCVRFRSFLLLLAVAAVAPGCNKTPPNDKGPKSSSEPMQVGFIAVGPLNDFGFNYAQNQGRLAMEKAMMGEVETSIVENIPENNEVTRVMERMISSGTKLIFPTSFGYLDPALDVASRHPNVVFMHSGGYKMAPNLGTYSIYMHEPFYIAGMVAGHMSKTKKMGFVGAQPVPPVVRNINAFLLGARSVNPDVVLHVVWTNKWSDPATESEAAKGLIEVGADVLTMHQDSPVAIIRAAEEKGIFSVGCHADASQFAPNGWLTGIVWDLGEYYAQTARAVKSGSWKAEQYRAGMESGIIKLAPFGKAVPTKVREEGDALADKIRKGEFVVFQGPLSDRDGKERVAAGQKPERDLLDSMNWFVEGVQGTLPK